MSSSSEENFSENCSGSEKDVPDFSKFTYLAIMILPYLTFVMKYKNNNTLCLCVKNKFSSHVAFLKKHLTSSSQTLLKNCQQNIFKSFHKLSSTHVYICSIFVKNKYLLIK